MYEQFLKHTDKLAKCEVLLVRFVAIEHRFQPTMIHLLRKCAGVRRLVVQLSYSMVRASNNSLPFFWYTKLIALENDTLSIWWPQSLASTTKDRYGLWILYGLKLYVFIFIFYRMIIHASYHPGVHVTG
jgi:hypothetical protein